MQSASDMGVCFQFGSNPTATTTDPLLPPLANSSQATANTGQYLTFKVNPGTKAAFIPSNGAATHNVVIIELGY